MKVFNSADYINCQTNRHTVISASDLCQKKLGLFQQMFELFCIGFSLEFFFILFSKAKAILAR